MTEREWIRLVVRARRERRAALRFALALALEAEQKRRRARVLAAGALLAMGAMAVRAIFC